jgi:hypothetical protein
MYAYLSHLFIYNDICCSMNVINIMVMIIMMFVGLRPGTIKSWLSYKIWDIRSANRVYVDNLGPLGIGETLRNFGRLLYKNCKK